MKMRKNEWISERGRRAMRTFAVLGAALLLIWCDPIVSRAEATGTVIPSSVNIRKEPIPDSEVIGSTTGGKEITIKGKVSSSGYTWYQVYVQGDTLGYVRADMVEQKGDDDIPTITVSTSSTEAAAPEAGTENPDAAETGGSETPASSAGAQVQAQEEMDKQYATIKVASAKVRPDPSTSNNPVESIASGTQVVVSGKSEGSDSKTWYYVTFTGSNGSEKTGFIRSDLLDLGEMLPVEEEPPVEEPQEEPEEPETTPNNDYELGIETDSEGQQVWYIYDHVMNQQQPLVPLLEASYAKMLENTDDTDAIVKQRIVIVVLAVLLAVFVIAVIILAIKLRNAYYEDYEDDEEEEDEEEPSENRRSARREREKETQERQPRRRTSDEEERGARRREDKEERNTRRRENEEERGSRRREGEEPASRAKSDRTERKRREVSYEGEKDAEEAAKPAKTRKAKNFLLDDDEFEFEFLNMDDKDLK